MFRTPLAPLTVVLGALALLALTPLAAQAQATSRTCSGQAGETPGPACLVAHQDLGALPPGPLYWNIYTFADAQAAERAKPPHGVVVEAFGQVWLFDVAARATNSKAGVIWPTSVRFRSRRRKATSAPNI
jgi:hypothetical protein